MPRSSLSRPIVALQRPQSLESPFKASKGFRPKEWFRFENAADGTDTTHIYIYDMIGGWFGVTADEMIAQLKEVDTGSITLHINSPGGDVFDGVAIYNALRSHKAKVNVVVDALAASAASFIAQSGDTVTMNRGSMMMIHDASAGSYENAAGHRETADILDKVSNSIASIYALRAGGTEAAWRATMIAEAWYTAQEAVDNGLADKVGEDQAVNDPTDEWDLSIFNYAGRAYAPSPAAVMTRAKEAAVSDTDQKKDQDKPEAQPGEPAQNAPVDPEELDDADDAEDDNDADDEGTDAQADEQKPSAKAKVTPQDTLPKAIMVNGKLTTSMSEVEAHVATLEGFVKETTDQRRKDFVEDLATAGKVSAAKIEDLQGYALGLSDSGYTAWVATWDAVPENPMFAHHGGGGKNENGDDTQMSAKDAKIQTAKDIVAQHRNSGMKEEQLKQTPSYKFLEENDAL